MELLNFFTDDTLQHINIEYCLKILKKGENKHMIHLYHEKKFIKPSELLSEKLGFDIHQNWVMPFSECKHEDIELLVHAVNTNNKTLEELFKLLAYHNPKMNTLIELVKVEPESYKKLDIILGVISKFNFHDIKEYIEDGYAAVKYADIKWKSRMDKLELIYGHIDYVMSNVTLDYVFKKLTMKSEPIVITVYSGKSIAANCRHQLHPEDEVLAAKSIIDLKKSMVCYSNSPDFVSAIKYIGEKEGIATEFFLDDVCHHDDIEPIFADFNKAHDLLNELAGFND